MHDPVVTYLHVINCSVLTSGEAQALLCHRHTTRKQLVRTESPSGWSGPEPRYILVHRNVGKLLHTTAFYSHRAAM